MQKKKIILLVIIILILMGVGFGYWYFLIYGKKPTIKAISTSPENPKPQEVTTFCVNSQDKEGVTEVTFIIGNGIYKIKGEGQKNFSACADSEFPEDGKWQVQVSNIEGQTKVKEIK